VRALDDNPLKGGRRALVRRERQHRPRREGRNDLKEVVQHVAERRLIELVNSLLRLEHVLLEVYDHPAVVVVLGDLKNHLRDAQLLESVCAGGHGGK